MVLGVVNGVVVAVVEQVQQVQRGGMVAVPCLALVRAAAALD
jgi:hypothetical protein